MAHQLEAIATHSVTVGLFYSYEGRILRGKFFLVGFYRREHCIVEKFKMSLN